MSTGETPKDYGQWDVDEAVRELQQTAPEIGSLIGELEFTLDSGKPAEVPPVMPPTRRVERELDPRRGTIVPHRQPPLKDPRFPLSELGVGPPSLN